MVDCCLLLHGSDLDYRDSYQNERKCLKIQFSLGKKLGMCNIILANNLSACLRFCWMINTVEKMRLKKLFS